jgi:hypothetical protein
MAALTAFLFTTTPIAVTRVKAAKRLKRKGDMVESRSGAGSE